MCIRDSPYIDQTLPVNGYHQKPLIGDAPLPNQPLHDAMPQKVNQHSPFVALHHEVVDGVEARRQSTAFDDSHLQVDVYKRQDLYFF